MENKFNFSRFGKYFTYDLSSRWEDQRAYLLFTALFPFILYLFSIAMAILSHGPHALSAGIGRPDISMRLAVFAIMAMIFLVQLPSRAYGHITDKSKGSAWVLLPASTPEKFASMMLTCLVVIPVAFFCVYFLGDAFVCLLDKNCGDSIAAAWIGAGGPQWVNVDGDIHLGGNGIWFMISAVLRLLSVFLVGALIFKKRKVIGTLLVLFAISFVLSGIMAFVMRSIDLPLFNERMTAWASGNADRIGTIANLCNAAWLAIVVIGCGVWSWFRVKNVQH